MAERLRVWDLPTRAFHWALAACVIGSLATIRIGGEAIAWHFRCGYAILALILFRLAWGFVGPRYARFRSFPPNPAAAWREFRGRGSGVSEEYPPGHSPLGALSVYAMLLALAVQVSTGLFSSDAILWDGPLKNLVSNDASDLLTRIHKVNRLVLVALVALHLAAIAYYRIARGRGLVGPMLSGDSEPGPGGATCPEPARDDAAVRVGAMLLMAGCAAAVWWIVRLGSKASSGF